MGQCGDCNVGCVCATAHARPGLCLSRQDSDQECRRMGRHGRHVLSSHKYHTGSCHLSNRWSRHGRHQCGSHKKGSEPPIPRPPLLQMGHLQWRRPCSTTSATTKSTSWAITGEAGATIITADDCIAEPATWAANAAAITACTILYSTKLLELESYLCQKCASKGILLQPTIFHKLGRRLLFEVIFLCLRPGRPRFHKP